MSVRVLVVDDSATMRGLISATLSRDAAITVVGQAADPIEARAAIKALNPDVVTLDIEMPNMNGLDFLERLMRLRPTPVVMCSTLTLAGAEASLRALELGAVDCVAKSGDGATPPLADLAEKVKAAAGARVRTRFAAPPSRPAPPGGYTPDGRILAIGSSTGGVEALIEVLSGFPKNCPPTLITQHMPASFTPSFAARLDRICPAKAAEAENGAPVLPGHIYLARGGIHLELAPGSPPRCRLVPGETVNGHRPSVDVLFASVAKHAGKRAIGVILTGMGGDGAQGLLTMRRAGADTLGQDEASSVVYGMPRVAFNAGAVAAQVPLDRMADRILALSNADQKDRRPCLSPAR